MSFKEPTIDLSAKFNLYDEELTDLGNQIQNLIIEIRQSRGDERIEKIQVAKNLLEQIKKTYQKLSAAAKKEMDQEKKENFISSKEKHKNQVSKYKVILQQIMNDVEEEFAKKQRTDDLRQQLLGTSINDKNNNISPIVPDISRSVKITNKAFKEKQEQEQKLQEQLEQELFKDVFEAQKESLDILERLNKKVEISTNIAIESGQLLREQREDLYEIDRQLDELGGNTKRARNELTTILRRLAADKFILVLSIFVILGILIFILVSIALSIYNRFTKKEK